MTGSSESVGNKNQEHYKKHEELNKQEEKWRQIEKDKKIRLLWITLVVAVLSLCGLTKLSWAWCYIGLPCVTFVITFALRKFWLREWDSKKVYYSGLALYTIMIIIISSALNTPENTEINDEQTQVTSDTVTQPIQEEVKKPEVKLPKYEIVYTLTGARYDGGSNLFVLIDPVKPSNTKFKTDIQNLTNYLTQTHGGKISIDFFDNKRALEIIYQGYASQRPRTASDEVLLDTHYIAGFSGNLETDIYRNTMYYYPGASKDTPGVGQYVAVEEYNPIQITIVDSSPVKDTPAPIDMEAEYKKKQRKKINDQLAEWKSKDFILELRPEVNTVYVNPLVWLANGPTEQHLITRVFNDYCEYACAIPEVVHVKDRFSGKELARGIKGHDGRYNIELK